MSADETLMNQSRYAEEEEGDDYEKDWEYFDMAIELFPQVKDFVFEITSAKKEGFQWWKLHKTPQNGLTSLSDKTRYLAPITNEDQKILRDKIWAMTGEIQIKFFRYMLPVICDSAYDPKKSICRAIGQQLSRMPSPKVEVQTRHSISISEDHPAIVQSFVPELSQFPKALLDLNLTYLDFLGWLFAEPEKEMFALHIGRAATGPQGAILAGKDVAIQHSYRYALILKGQPFVGKSWFNNFLVSGFEFCGLQTAVIHDLTQKFGHREWVSANYSYLDDTNEDKVGGFFRSDVLKTICTNGLIRTEDKGIDPITIKPMCAPILLANEIDSRHLANADSGNAHRIKIILCKDLHSLEVAARQLPSDCPYHGVGALIPAQVIKRVMELSGCSEQMIAAYFIRLCVDKFMSIPFQELANYVTNISASLYANYIASGLTVYAKAAVLAYLLKHGADKAKIDVLRHNYSKAVDSGPFILESMQCLADLTARLERANGGKLKALIKKHWNKSNRVSDHVWMTWRNYGIATLTKAGINAEAYVMDMQRKGRDSVLLEDIFKRVFIELRDAQGNPSNYSVSRVQAAWNAALVLNFDSIKSIYNFILTELKDSPDAWVLDNFRSSGSCYAAVYSKISKGELENLEYLKDDYFDNYEAPQLDLL